MVFSLEDEDYGNLFITQESNVGYNSKELCEKEELGESNMLFGVDRKDFETPCVSFIGNNVTEYSDISDAEDFEPNKDINVGSVMDAKSGNLTEKRNDLDNKSRGFSQILGLNSKRGYGWKRPVGISKAVSKMRKFKNISADKLTSLKTNRLKKRTFNKMQWSVRAYCDWRKQKLESTTGFDVKIFNADIEEVAKLTKSDLVHALVRFIPEVTKLKDGSDYPGKTLYEMITLIQKHLHQNNKFWKLLDDEEFREVRVVLDNVMKERAENNIGTVTKKAEFIPMDLENELWERGVLGEDTPDKLRNTVLYLLGVNLGLRAGDEHYDLRRETSVKPSKITFERDSNGRRCLVYREDSITKTNDGGLRNLKKEHKVVWVFPSENSVRCPVRLVDKYVSLLPPVGPKTKKCNFYLRSLERPNPAQWYGEKVVGRNTLCKVVGEMLKNSNNAGFFTNHSLRRTGTMRLFQAGIDRKIVKEYTGHVSDAVDKYQITSEKQKNEISKVLCGEFNVKEGDDSLKCGEIARKESEPSVEVSVKNSSDAGVITCSCKKNTMKIGESDKIGQMISTLVNAKKTGKTTVRIEIEFSDD